MGHAKTNRPRASGAPLAALATALLCLILTPSALAGGPFHTRAKALDVSGLNHACGVAADSEGDLYASSASESKIKIFDSTHTELTSIEDTHEPCALAVSPKGEIFASERATGEVVRYLPNAYPFSGTPTYGSREAIDSSGKAKGIYFDHVNNPGGVDRLYVAEGDHVSVYGSAGGLGINEAQSVVVSEATGGTFKLIFGGKETSALPFNATEAEVKAALEALSTLGAGNVEVQISGGYRITFTGALAHTDVEPFTADSSGLSGGVEPRASIKEATKGWSGRIEKANEAQWVTVSEATGGTFKLIFGGKETSALPFNATGAEAKAALEALLTIGTGNVEVEKPGASYRVTFTGALAHTDVELLGANGAALTGSKNKGVIITESTRGRETGWAKATGVATYTYTDAANSRLNLFVADAEGDTLKVFSGPGPASLKLRRTITGVDQDGNPETPEQAFGFGAAGAYLGADPGNETKVKTPFDPRKCAQVGEQACTAGHFFLYDATHGVIDELDASGGYVDQFTTAGLDDAEPTQVAVDRSGGEGDGTIYVSSGSGPGAKLLAFAPLGMPVRAPVPALSRVLAQAAAVATDDRGDVYVAAAKKVRVYSPAGKELTSFTDAEEARDLAVDSKGNVYALGGEANERTVAYYVPAKYPPESATAYSRHKPNLIPNETLEGEGLAAIAVNPADDHLFAIGNSDFSPVIAEFKSAAEGSAQVAECGSGIGLANARQDIDVYGATGQVYASANPEVLYAIQCGAEKEVVREIRGGGCPGGTIGGNPTIAVDQANGHALEFESGQGAAREYDGAGACVAEFGIFSIGGESKKIAIDSSCALHKPPLTAQTTPTCASFDPADGTVYVAFDAPNNTIQPNDVNAFGPLDYGTPAKHKLTVKKAGTGSGKVISSPAGIDCGSTCSAEYEATKVVTLTATPGPGSAFAGWSGCEAEPSAGECEVTVSEDTEVKAEFESTGSAEIPLEVVLEGPGSGEVSSEPSGIECLPTCTAQFGKDVKATLKAKAAKGSEFAGWSGCEAEPSAGECEVTMSEPMEVKAEFDIEHPLLTVVRKGTGSGKVTSSPAAIDCGATCSAKFNLDDEVTLEAQAGEGSVFAGWGGACSGKEPTCEVTMTEAKEATASFPALPRAKVEQALPLGYSEATLRGEVDPSSLASEYRFEYLTQAQYEENGETFAGAQSTPAGELAAGEGLVAVNAPLTGLAEGTAYRFRLLAENAVGEASAEGPAFETLERAPPQSCANAEYRTGPSSFLPDCRAYELVTPAETRGKLLGAQTSGSGQPYANSWFVSPRGEGAGDSVGYAIGALPGFNGTGQGDVFRAQRRAGEHPAAGWANELQSFSFAQSGGTGPAGHGVSPDQRYWLLDVLAIATPSKEEFPLGNYLRVPAGTASGQCAPEPRAQFESADPEAKFELVGCGSLGTDLKAEGRFLAAGGGHVVFTSKEHLEGGVAPAGTEAIYSREVGSAEAEVVSVKPDGSPFGGGEGATYIATSEDGAAVVFGAGGKLYVHHEGATTEIAAGPFAFDGISTDGLRVFYIDEAVSSEPSRPIPTAGLFACDTEAGPCAGPGAHEPTEIASKALFVNVPADGSHAFFTSEEELPGVEANENGEEAQDGDHNLYAWDGSNVSFVAILDQVDFEGFRGEGVQVENQETLDQWTRAIPGQRNQAAGFGRAFSPTRSTPDGSVLVFQSHARLTGYENEGRGEIYRYAPGAPAGERLTCASCDPSGAPAGADALLQAFEPFGATNPDTLVPSLADDGRRVFFQSRDRLLPEDANSTNDVYEWKAKGTVGAGGDTCERPGGCLALISSGQGESPSYLYGMSADGHDVFFEAQDKLVGQDVTGSPSLYDARVLGGIPDPPVPAPCEGDACQGQGSTPPNLPASATTGVGNGNEEPKLSPCAKGKHRVTGRCVAKHHKKRHKRSKHRANRNRGAHR